MRVPDAVGAGVAAADHDHVLAGRGDHVHGRRRCADDLRPELARHPAVALVQVLHREVHAVELAAGDGEIARHPRADGEDDGVMLLAQLLRGHVDADVDAVAEDDALRLELLHAPLDEPLLDLEVGHAEAHETAGRLVALVDRDRMAGARQLLRAREPRGAGTDDCHAPAAARASGLRDDPALVPGAVHDRDLDLLDRHCVALVDLEDARGLARRGAETARELGEVVRPVELLDRLAPAVAVDEVVPLRDQVAERAAVVAERHPALHAARALLLQHRQLDRAHELAVVADPLARVALGLLDPPVLEEAAELAHHAASSDSVVTNPLPVDTGWSPFGSTSSSASARL